MTFFGLFKSPAHRKAELKTRVRQASIKINKFVNRLSVQSNEYATLARRAFDLNDQMQFRQLAASYLQSQDGINRWQRYLIKLKTLELRQQEVDATQEFLSGMNALTNSIMNGVKPEEILAVTSDMQAAFDRSEQLENVLEIALDDVCTHVDNADLSLLDSLESGKLLSPLSDSEKQESEKEFWSAMEKEKNLAIAK